MTINDNIDAFRHKAQDAIRKACLEKDCEIDVEGFMLCDEYTDYKKGKRVFHVEYKNLKHRAICEITQNGKISVNIQEDESEYFF